MSHEARVLVFVHDATDGELVEMQMRKARVRCTVQRVTQKDQFLKAMRTTPPDLAIVDGGFPRIDMAGVVRNALQTSPGIPWVVLTSNQAEDVLVRWMKAGAADVVTRKNYTRLTAVATELLAQRMAAQAPGASQPVSGAVPLDAFGEPIAPAAHEGARQAPSPRDAMTPPLPAAAPAPSTPHVSPAAQPPQEDRLFREIVEHAADLISVLDAQGKRLYSNAAHADVLDTPERLQGTVAFVDVHPEDRLTVSDAYREAVGEGKAFRAEYRLMDKKGSVRVMDSLATVIASPGGEPRTVIISRDVTDRTQQEQDRGALLRALGPLTGERFFHNLVYVLADTLRVRYVLVAESLYQPYERVRSVAYWANGTLMPSFEYDLADTTCAAVYATRGPVHYPDSVQELFPRETALVEMEAHAYLGVPLIGTDSSIVGHLFVMDDKRMADPSRALHMLMQAAGRTAMEIERLHQEQTLHGAESRLRFILESLADGVLATDTLEIITYLSEQVGSLLGYSSVDMIGKPLMQFVGFPEGEQETALPGEGEVSVRLRCGDGTYRAAALRARPLKDGAGRIIGTVFLVHPLTG